MFFVSSRSDGIVSSENILLFLHHCCCNCSSNLLEKKRPMLYGKRTTLGIDGNLNDKNGLRLYYIHTQLYIHNDIYINEEY